MTVKASDKSIPVPLTTVIFSTRDGATMAGGDNFGRLYFWKVPQSLSSTTIQQKNMFQSLAFIDN